MKPIQKLEGLHTLFNHTYRNFILNRSGLMEWHFNTTSKIVNNINLYKICRPLSRFTANGLTTLLLNTVDGGGKINMNINEISLESVVSQVDGQIVSDMGGEKVMLSIHNGKYYNLGGLGGRIWEQLIKTNFY